MMDFINLTTSDQFSLRSLPPFLREDKLEYFISDALHQYLDFRNQIETPQQAQARRNALDRLEDVLSNWIYNTYHIKLSNYMKHYKRGDSNGRLGIIQPYGSYYIGAHTPTSDIDSIVLLPSYVDLQDFFAGFTLILKSIPGVSRVQYIKAAHSLINLIIDGYEFDLQPAIMDLSEIKTRNFDFLEQQQLLPCNQNTRQTLGSIAVNVWIREQTAFQQTLFQQFVRLIKMQTSSSGMSSNKLGLFGGVNIALLCANIMIHNKSERLNLFRLVYAYFYFYCKYDWRVPLLVNKVEYQNNNLDSMQLITPVSPIFNSLQKVTESTRTVILMIWKNCMQSIELLYQQYSQIPVQLRGDLIRPSQMALFFMPHDRVNLQFSTFFNSFVTSKDYNAGFLIISVAGDTGQAAEIQKLKEKVEPLLVNLFKQLQLLKENAIGNQATINYIRPWPDWFDDCHFSNEQPQTTSTFFIGVARTEGDRVWLSQKLGELLADFKIRVRNKLEKKPEDEPYVQLWNGVFMNIVGRRQIVAEMARLQIYGFSPKPE